LAAASAALESIPGAEGCARPRGKARARPGLVTRVRDGGARGEERFSDLKGETGWAHDIVSGLLKPVSGPCLRAGCIETSGGQPMPVSSNPVPESAVAFFACAPEPMAFAGPVRDIRRPQS
jgi:hypothetical protein